MNYLKREQEKFMNRLHKIMGRIGSGYEDILEDRANDAAFIAEYGDDDFLEVRKAEYPDGYYAHLKWRKDRQDPPIKYPDSTIAALKRIAEKNS